MHQTKKGNAWHFGMKAHIGVDAEAGLVHTVATAAKVEHPFHVIKNLFRHKKTRYKGLAKNEAQFFSLFGLANLVIAKRSLLRVAARGAS